LPHGHTIPVGVPIALTNAIGLKIHKGVKMNLPDPTILSIMAIIAAFVGGYALGWLGDPHRKRKTDVTYRR
jgi:hypothetical protein